MPQVKCSVANCAFWESGNHCAADMIMIEIDKHADLDFNEEFAGEGFDSEHQDTAVKTAGTCCHTFQPKEH